MFIKLRTKFIMLYPKYGSYCILKGIMSIFIVFTAEPTSVLKKLVKLHKKSIIKSNVTDIMTYSDSLTQRETRENPNYIYQ